MGIYLEELRKTTKNSWYQISSEIHMMILEIKQVFVLPIT
jgi:hypothetical protein